MLFTNDHVAVLSRKHIALFTVVPAILQLKQALWYCTSGFWYFDKFWWQILSLSLKVPSFNRTNKDGTCICIFATILDFMYLNKNCFTQGAQENSRVVQFFLKVFFSKPRNYNTFVLFEVFFTRLSTSGNIDVLVIAFYKVYVAKLEDVP